jgi:regulator of protease activity HflC (stomatin/prohibitin superfamily)
MFEVGICFGLIVYGLFRALFTGFYTVRPNERAVITSFGRARRLSGESQVSTTPSSDGEPSRYAYPSLRVIKPGGPYFKWPWQKVHKVDIATQAVDLTWDPTKSQSTIEAVTKDKWIPLCVSTICAV